ncbi:glycosyltransferase family A protein [Desertivirga arenae]|uniref:glycosyltransferase family A protein n=1 Tax=Desertivirga arenae TaxID=2810309 RepID=UPI001A967DCA|nr:glycosyltransferase family A protein [Pedobacter sp. SYSU D00823]
MSSSYYFKGITLLITHYNRSKSLERLLRSFKDQGYQFEDIVVSDDGSKIEHMSCLLSLQKDYSFNLVTTPENKGLGNNINKGQEAVKTPYTLYVQEDFVPKALFLEKLKFSHEFMETHPEFDMVRYYAYFKYPSLKPFGNGFSEMVFNWWSVTGTYRKFYYYSDHPHLRRSNFLTKFGRYCEGVKGDVTEYRMMMAFLKNKGKALFYEDYNDLFDQVNSSTEPSTMKRNFWRESNSWAISALRHLYRHLRFNYDYHF